MFETSYSPNPKAAAGYHQYMGSGVGCPPIVYRGIIERFWESSFLPFISCTDYKIEYGKCMRFQQLPLIKVKRYQKNQVLKPDTWEIREEEVRVGVQSYFNYKIDKYDYDKMCIKGAYQTSIIEGARRTLHEDIACNMLAHIVANVDCANTGQFAGANGRIPINTGYPGAPRPVSPSNMDELYIDATAILAQQKIYIDGNNPAIGNGFVMIIPTELQRLYGKSEVLRDLIIGNCECGCEFLIDGMICKKLFGYKTIVTDCLPVGYDQSKNFEGFYVIAMATCAVGFGGLDQDIWIGRGNPRDNGWYIQGFFEHGYHLFYPEAVVVFYVTPVEDA